MKCPICTTKKGKRSCKLTTTCICSLCFGANRKAEPCEGCSFYHPPKKEYKHIPFYYPSEMDGYSEREDISDVIERTLATFDYATEDQLKDNDAIQILEMLLDLYYFGDETIPESSSPLVEEGFRKVFNSIHDNLSRVSHEELSKIIGAIWFVAKRRTTGQREYLSIIRQHVGICLDNNVRLCIDQKLGKKPNLEKLTQIFKR